MIYVASPYTYKSRIPGLSWLRRYLRYRAITKIIGRLQDKYPYAFIGPITQSHNTAKYMLNSATDFKSWARRDLTYISHCDEMWVVLLDGWNQSTGVLAEVKFLKSRRNFNIKFIDPITLLTQLP